MRNIEGLENEMKIEMVCEECSNKSKEIFQQSGYIKTLKIIDKQLKKSQKGNANIKYYVAKIPLQKLKEFSNGGAKYYFNEYLEEDKNCKSEHVWITIGDINFKKRTICGILNSQPLFVNVKEGSIIISKFKDIEDIQEYLI